MRTYDSLWDAVFSECKRLSAAELDEIARRAEIPPRSLREYLWGRPGIGYARVVRLADALGLEVTVITRRYVTNGEAAA